MRAQLPAPKALRGKELFEKMWWAQRQGQLTELAPDVVEWMRDPGPYHFKRAPFFDVPVCINADLPEGTIRLGNGNMVLVDKQRVHNQLMRARQTRYGTLLEDTVYTVCGLYNEGRRGHLTQPLHGMADCPRCLG